MRAIQGIVVFVSFVLSISVLLNCIGSNISLAQTTPDVFVGIDMGYGNNVTGVKKVIDEVKAFSNFFILGTYGLSMNVTRLNQTLQYAYDNGMYFMCFPPVLYQNASTPNMVPNATKAWLNYAKSSWGDHLVGFMYPYEDEPGGHQLDHGGQYLVVDDMKNTSYVDAAKQFTDSMWFWDLNRTKSVTGYPVFTSDYALYWFDYKGGYDGLFAEFGWNYSRQLNVALCRGAASVLNKEWGVVITYTYTTPPYMESGEELYRDLIYAYDSGAKYIVVLDTNPNWTAGALTTEHFQALKKFWQHIQDNPRVTYSVNERIAYVLPEAYAYGFRGPLDNIWGVWEANMTSFMLSISVNIMLEKYGSKLDIIYEDALKLGNDYNYSKIIYWNNPAAVSDLWPQGFLPTSSLTPQPTASPEEKPRPQSIYMIAAVIVGVALTIFFGILIIFRKKLLIDNL